MTHTILMEPFPIKSDTHYIICAIYIGDDGQNFMRPIKVYDGGETPHRVR